MRVGIIVDGQAEFRSLPRLIDRIDSSHTVVQTLYADIQPFASVAQIAGAVKRKVPIMEAKRANMVVVLIDRKSRNVCPGEWAVQIQENLQRACRQSGITSFAVITKNSCYENWLVSDIEALRQMPGRFDLRPADVSRIEPNKADRINAQELLKRAARRRSYSKVNDAVRIMDRANPMRMATNSRSFRRFMRLLNHPTYANQSRNPAT